MANPNGAKGSLFERSLLPLLCDYWPESVRLGKQGVKDCGDFHMPFNTIYVIEAKNVQRLNLAGWLEEARIEAANKGVPFGVVVHKRRGVSDPMEQYLTLRFGDFLEMMHG